MWPDRRYRMPGCQDVWYDSDDEKKCSEEMQTLHAGCSKVEPKIVAPPQTLSQGRGLAKI